MRSVVNFFIKKASPGKEQQIFCKNGSLNASGFENIKNLTYKELTDYFPYKIKRNYRSFSLKSTKN